MESDLEQEYPLCFENHESILIQSLTDFFIKKAYVNVTLVCKGEEIKAHQTILAACSSVFDKLLRQKSEHHPIIIFNDVSKEEMVALLEFMYKGRVNVPKTTLPSLLKIAKNFKIRGLEHAFSIENGIQSTSSRKGGSIENSGIANQFLRTWTPNRTKIVEPELSVFKTTICARRDSCSESKAKVRNPFARKRRKFEDSDSTFCEEDLARPGPSRPEAFSTAIANYDSDIEIIDSNPVVIVNESQPDINSSPELVRRTQLKKKIQTTENHGDITENLSKKTNKTVIQDSEDESTALTNKNNNRKPESSSVSPKTAEDTTRPLKKRKYNKSYSAVENIELLKLPFRKLRSYCILCCRFKRDLQTHIKQTHNLTPRGKISCKVCLKVFFRKEFLKFHKCKPV